MLDHPNPAPDSPLLDPAALAKAISGYHFIGGRYTPARSGRRFPVVNPATGEAVAEAADGDAADAGVEGTVILRVKVSAEGRATGMGVERLSGHASLDAAAMARVRDWRFTPRMKDGAPVAGEVLVPVEFRAEARPPAGE